MRPPPDPACSPFDAPTLPVNGLAVAYQPRRSMAATISIGWNLLIAFLFLAHFGAWRLYLWLDAIGGAMHLPHRLWVIPSYLTVVFIGYSILNYPLELYFGYLEERQFGLAKDGVRAWTRDWLIGCLQHGLMFVLGSSLLLTLQFACPHTWLAWAAVALLGLFLLTTYLAMSLLPEGLFDLEPVDAATRAKLAALVAPLADRRTLPPIMAYSAPNLRDFSGGLVGLGHRKVMLISRAALTAASDSLLRFVLVHDLGHRRYHHILLSTLAGWAWVAIGLCVSDVAIVHVAPFTTGVPPYVAWLALCLSLWMALGEPLLAYLGRRLEYQADRYYLRQGGTVAEMAEALQELSRRNLARTDGLRRRDTIFHPLPSVWNRLHRARVFARKLAREQ